MTDLADVVVHSSDNPLDFNLNNLSTILLNTLNAEILNKFVIHHH